MEEVCPINLRPHQVQHVKDIWELLVQDQVFSFIDTSETGLGKTITSLMIAWKLQKKYGTSVFIVAPSDNSLNNDDGWLSHAEKFGIEVKTSSTYSALRGGRGSVSHPWLIPDPKKKKNWVASPEFEELCSRGLFLIFDEFHHTKNPSMSHFASAALVKMAKKYRKVCRVALLSHTPGEKPDAYPQILRMTGLVTSTKMFKHIPFTSSYEWVHYGLGELARVCDKVGKNSEGSVRIRDAMYRFSASKCNHLCKDMYDQYLRGIITFAMPKPEMGYEKTTLNAFLETSEEDLKVLNDGIRLLSGAVGWDPVKQEVAPKTDWKLTATFQGLKLIERGKLSSIASYVLREKEKDPRKKFIISCGSKCIDHHNTLAALISQDARADPEHEMIQELRRKNKNWKNLPKDMVRYICRFIGYIPEVLNGSTSKEERVKILRRFQADTDDSWCLIISPGTGSESISLHDKHGDRPREMLIVPDFYFSRTIQSCGRINRVGVKSDTKTLIVYSKDAQLETSILQSMVRKSNNARDLLAKGQKVVFPGEFPFWIEGKSDPVLEQQLAML